MANSDTRVTNGRHRERRLVVTAVDAECVQVPGLKVDAVVEAPFGSHPGEMSGMYERDEEPSAEELRILRDEIDKDRLYI